MQLFTKLKYIVNICAGSGFQIIWKFGQLTDRQMEELMD